MARASKLSVHSKEFIVESQLCFESAFYRTQSPFRCYAWIIHCRLCKSTNRISKMQDATVLRFIPNNPT